MESYVSATDSRWVRERTTKIHETFYATDSGHVRLVQSMLSAGRRVPSPSSHHVAAQIEGLSVVASGSPCWRAGVLQCSALGCWGAGVLVCWCAGAAVVVAVAAAAAAAAGAGAGAEAGAVAVAGAGRDGAVALRSRDVFRGLPHESD